VREHPRRRASERPGEAQAVHDRGLVAGEIEIQGRGDLEALSEGEAVFRTDALQEAAAVVGTIDLHARAAKSFNSFQGCHLNEAATRP